MTQENYERLMNMIREHKDKFNIVELDFLELLEHGKEYIEALIDFSGNIMTAAPDNVWANYQNRVADARIVNKSRRN